MVLVKNWFNNDCSRADSTGGVSKFHIITSSYSFTSDGDGCDSASEGGMRRAQTQHSRRIIKEPQENCGQGIELISPELAVKEGASVERNNVRRSYVHS